jgi:hypothetical protein
VARIAPKQLLVEGNDDLYAIVALMKSHGIDWPDKPAPPPVQIKAEGGVDAMLKRANLSSNLKQAGLEVLGIVVDADDDPESRWETARANCLEAFPDLPAALPPSGLILENTERLRFGFWMMPDCASAGMLETFLRHLVPSEQAMLWDHAQASAVQAKGIGADYAAAHTDKAHIHTWLAWQDPPGVAFGRALTRKTLNPHTPAAVPFVAWFKTLFQL